MSTLSISLSEVSLSVLNTRSDLRAGTEDATLKNLAADIKNRGLINPITVRSLEDGKYEVIAGQRRVLACIEIGWKEIEAIVRDDLSDDEASLLSLTENVQRADMNPMDKARAYKRVYDRVGSYQAVARQVSVSATTARRYLDLLNLTPGLQEKVSTSEGVVGVGRFSDLARNFAEEDQDEALKELDGLDNEAQGRIIRQSGGDLDTLRDLKEQEVDNRIYPMCREGLCFMLLEHDKLKIKMAFERRDGAELNQAIDGIIDQ